MLSKVEMNKIALKYNCWINIANRLYLVGEKVIYLGRVYGKESGYYHAVNSLEKKYEGQKDFEVLLVSFLKGENIIK
jgi:hypothetical protein